MFLVDVIYQRVGGGSQHAAAQQPPTRVALRLLVSDFCDVALTYVPMKSTGAAKATT